MRTKQTLRSAAIIALLGLTCFLAQCLFVETAHAQPRPDAVRKRYNRVAKGANVEEWRKRLSDKDPEIRLDAVTSLGEAGTEASVEPLLEATADADERVRLKACDYLGSIGSVKATPQLTQTLFLKGVDLLSKQRILIALGRIKDPRSANPLLNFAKNTRKETLATAALYALGEIAEKRTLAGVEKIRDTTDNPEIQRVASDAAEKIHNKVIAKPNAQPTLIELERRFRPPEPPKKR